MVNLTRIYTRTGDDGTTSLGDLSRTGKNDPRLHAYADSNEANAVIGVALAAGGLGDAVRETLLRVQNELFDVGADLSTPLRETYEWPPLRVQQPWVDDLEHDCDTYLTQVEKLRSFILPGGSVGSAHLHHATTVVRRAERSTWAAIDAHGTGEGGVNPLTATYLNRLSDLLFILARIANVEHGGDVLWQPGGGRVEAPSRRGGRSRRGQGESEPSTGPATEPTTEPTAEDAGSAS